MSETMIIKLSELTRVIWAVAFLSLETGRVSVWKDGSRLFTMTPDARVEGDASADVAKAEGILRSFGWSVAGEWDRPSPEWQEVRVPVMGTEPVTDVPAGWATV